MSLPYTVVVCMVSACTMLHDACELNRRHSSSCVHDCNLLANLAGNRNPSSAICPAGIHHMLEDLVMCLA